MNVLTSFSNGVNAVLPGCLSHTWQLTFECEFAQTDAA